MIMKCNVTCASHELQYYHHFLKATSLLIHMDFDFDNRNGSKHGKISDLLLILNPVASFKLLPQHTQTNVLPQG